MYSNSETDLDMSENLGLGRVKNLCFGLDQTKAELRTRLDQTSAEKNTESPDSSVSSLSGWTDGHRRSFFSKSGQNHFSQNPDIRQNQDRQNPDKNETGTVLSADVWS